MDQGNLALALSMVEGKAKCNISTVGEHVARYPRHLLQKLADAGCVI